MGIIEKEGERNKMLKVIISKDKTILEKQLKALECQVAKDTNEQYLQMYTQALKSLKEETLFQQYLQLQSKKWKATITGFEGINEPGKDIAIKVNFENGKWLRAYSNNGEIEW